MYWSDGETWWIKQAEEELNKATRVSESVRVHKLASLARCGQ